MRPLTPEKINVAGILGTPKNLRHLIPGYQREYAWTLKECEMLWDDFTLFALPQGENDTRPDDEEYPLGDIVVCPKDTGCIEIVDGQQRITTLLLLIRALYEASKDSGITARLGRCIFPCNKQLVLDTTVLKTTAEDYCGNPVTALHDILLYGRAVKKDKNNYAINFRFFRERVTKLTQLEITILSTQILDSVYVTRCYLENQDDAFALFEKKNDRGTPLTVEQLFKFILFRDRYAQGGYAFANAILNEWSILNDKCARVLPHMPQIKTTQQISPIMRAFALYATQTGCSVRSPADIKKFYSPAGHSLLRDSKTWEDINTFVDILISIKDGTFSVPPRILKKAYLLVELKIPTVISAFANYYFNTKTSFETDLVSLEKFLDFAIAFAIGLVTTAPKTQLRHYTSYCIKIYQRFLRGDTAEKPFRLFSLKDNLTRSQLKLNDTNRQRIFLAWWTLRSPEQTTLPDSYQIEHILAKTLAPCRDMQQNKIFQSWGNLALLEKNINQKISNLSFADKKRYYLGLNDCPPTTNLEIQQLARENKDFGFEEINYRATMMFIATHELLQSQNLLDETEVEPTTF